MLERSRFVVSEAVWEKVAPLLPGKLSDPGATARDNRLFLEAVLWRGGKGAPRRGLPRGVGYRENGFPRVPPRGEGGGFQSRLSCLFREAGLGKSPIGGT